MRCPVLTLLLALLLVAPTARAQLGLPARPALPTLPGLGLPIEPARPVLERDAIDELAQAAGRRARAVQTLLRRHAGRVESDPAGQPVVRGELLLVAPGDALLAAARERGYALLRERRIDALDARWVVLRPPDGLALVDALAALRALEPALEADFNHLYLAGGTVGTADQAAAAPRDAALLRVGLVDGGVDADHPMLRGIAVQRQGCGGAAHPQAHGTAVASLLAGPGTTLYAADIYCGAPTGGAVEAVAEALGWLAAERVAVVNLSLVGPPNRLLERAVRAMTTRGHLLVAAVGNDGPAAPPLFPAAYPGVVGVTAVGAARGLLPEAARGPQVVLAAPGADLSVARAGSSGQARARGTSFAAPLVTRLLAARLAAPEAGAAARALDALAREALDLGPPGRDPGYGWGLVGESR
jgi:subtilisin family serine protease